MATAPKFEFDDLLSMFESTVRKHTTRPAFGVRAPDKRWTWIQWGELAGRVDAMRGGLASKGVGRGDRVAIISNNRLEWLIGCYASYGLGATWVPMYEAMIDKDYKHILDDSGAKVCFVATPELDAKIKKLAPNVTRIQLGKDFDALLELGKQHKKAAIKPSGDDLAYFIYTSGTTGKPKGVRLTHRSLASNAQALKLVFPMSHEDRTLAFLPWAHVGGAGTEVNSIVLNGTSTAICEKADWILESLPVIQPTMLLAVPRIWNKIYDGVNKQVMSQPPVIRALFAMGVAASDKQSRGESLTLAERIALPLARKLIFSKVKARFGGRLKYACSGAAALSPDVGRFVQALGLEVYEAYGMTEASSIATVNPQGAARIGTVGKPMLGVEIKLDRAAAADPSQGGEIIIYGHGVMAGYHNLPDETKAAMTADGGMRSGDLGRFDDDGYLIITGRVKEIYKLENGKYVSPAPLEEKLTLSPLIAQVMLHGQDKPFNVALVVPDAVTLRAWAKENGIGTDDVAALCKDERVIARYKKEIADGAGDNGYERVEAFALVHEEVTVDNEMLTPTMKVKRRVVVERYRREIDALYADAKR
jgi:long-chain acyl-CoA synthetase